MFDNRGLYWPELSKLDEDEDDDGMDDERLNPSQVDVYGILAGPVLLLPPPNTGALGAKEEEEAKGEEDGIGSS